MPMFEAKTCPTTTVAERSDVTNSNYKPSSDDDGKSALFNDDSTASSKKESPSLHSPDDHIPDVYVLKLFHVLATLLRCMRFVIDE